MIPCLKVPELEYDGGEWWPGFWAEYIKVDAFSTDSKIYVPAMSQESYKNDYVWKTISNIIYAIEGETDYDVTIQAQEKTSDLSSVIGEENLGHVVSLKLTGTINGYDIKAIRERMPILRHLDLSDVDIIGNDYVYFTNEKGNQYHTSNDVLGGYFFYDLQNLRDVKLPNNIKEIETYAFSGCTNLERVEIPKDVNKIGNYAFDECNLKTVIVNKSEPALITTYTFPNCADITLMVLNGCKDAYLSASFWKDFKEIIDSTDYINFADKEVEKICISNWQNDFYVSNWIHNEEELYEDGLINWDRNGDKVLSKKEAANVKK